MNYLTAGANTRPSNGHGNRRGPHSHIDNNSAMTGLLSTLELRRLVAAMVD